MSPKRWEKILMSNDLTKLPTEISHHLSGQEEQRTPPHQFPTHVIPGPSIIRISGTQVYPCSIVSHGHSNTRFQIPFPKKYVHNSRRRHWTDTSQNKGGCGRFRNPCDLAQAFCHTLVTKGYILRLDRTSFEWSISADEKKAQVAFNKPV